MNPFPEVLRDPLNNTVARRLGAAVLSQTAPDSRTCRPGALTGRGFRRAPRLPLPSLLSLAFLTLASMILMTTTAARAAEALEALDDEVAVLSEKYDIVGLSAAGLREGKVVWETYLGRADLAREVPVTAETRFRVASISKVVTATALMQFQEKGRFSLDDDVSGLLGFKLRNPHHPDVPITFRHLLTHTASFADGAAYDDFLMYTYDHPNEAPGMSGLLLPGGSFFAGGAVFSENVPGAQYSYSNLAFGLIGTLVERLAGERFDRYCARTLFEPLDLSCRFNPTDLGTRHPLAVLYRSSGDEWEPRCDDYQGAAPPERLGEGYRLGWNALPCAPQGGLRASARDLARFSRVFTEPQFGEEHGILRASTVAQMQGEKRLTLHRAEKLMPGETWIGHTGSAYGLLSLMFWEESGPLGVIVLTNGSKPGTEEGAYTPMERELFAAIVRALRAVEP